MKVIDAIKEIMKSGNIGSTKLAVRLGRPQSTVSERLRQKSMTTAVASQLCHALDYRVVLVPVGARLPEGSYEVE